MTTKHERMTQRIEAHGRALLKIFPHATEQNPIKLCKALRRLEAKAAVIGLQLCNGPEMSDKELDDRKARILGKVDDLLGNIGKHPVPIFLNLDPRGHALKIRSEWMCEHPSAIHRDWGGYGIIAPDLREEN